MLLQSTQKMVKLAFVAFAGWATVAAAPVFANSSAAAVDVSDTVRTAQERSLNASDDRFRQLFSSWEALEDIDTKGAVKPAISIPSRMPVEGARLSSGFGMRTHPVLGGRRNHKGIDLAAPTGTPVYATADGMVGKAQWFSSYGLYISIDHGAELETRYAHLSKLAVEAGERVRKGDLIGYVGSTGRSTGPHLHYEVRVAGEAVNPAPYMVETEAQQAFALAMGEEGEADGQGGE